MQTKPSKLNYFSYILLIITVIFFWLNINNSLSQGLKIVTINSNSGKIEFKVKEAITSSEHALGLKFVKNLAKNQGMLFKYKKPREVSFWMKDTYIPLDIIFITKDREILSIKHKAQPLDETSILSSGEIIAVLEINGGLAENLGIKIGDKVEF